MHRSNVNACLQVETHVVCVRANTMLSSRRTSLFSTTCSASKCFRQTKSPRYKAFWQKIWSVVIMLLPQWLYTRSNNAFFSICFKKTNIFIMYSFPPTPRFRQSNKTHRICTVNLSTYSLQHRRIKSNPFVNVIYSLSDRILPMSQGKRHQPTGWRMVRRLR